MATASLQSLVPLASLFLTLVGSAACVELESELEFDDAESLRVGGVYVCPRYLCGSNAAIGGSFSFNTEGSFVLDSKRLTHVERFGQPLHLHLAGNTIYATRPNNSVLAGEALVGVKLHFTEVGTEAQTTLTIADVHPEGVESLLLPGVRYPTYEFLYTDSDGQTTELCADGDWDEGNLQPTTEALVVQHEAYDWYGDEIPNIEEQPGGSANWMTIGCSGGAFAKKVLMGYDMNNAAPYHSDRSENTTMMRMLTASYCGGDSFTQTGTPVYWQNDRHWFSKPDGEAIEAMWGPDGAVCLNTPRLAPRAQVVQACGPIPTCAGFDPRDYELVSYLPAN